ncbi:MFS transporter [Corynebacterium durum]|uniref:MFS transporter n=1 Tax=Corynebacterium durum TaxID=61592 RepID=UPI003616034A
MTNPNAARDVTETAPRPKIPREIWVLVAAAFIIAAGFGLVSPIIPQFARSFDVSTTAASAVVSVFAASRLLFAPASGKLIDLIGSRKVYITGLLTVAVTTGAVAFAQEYWHILAFRAIGGIGSTMFTVSAAGLIVRIAPPSIRGRASSTYATAFLLGSVIGPVAGSGLAVLGMRPPFLIYGVSLILASAVVWKLLRPEVIHDLESHDESTPMLASEAVKNPAYRSALISGFANGWVNFGVRVSTVPLFASILFPKGTAVAGMVLAAFAVGNAGCLQFSGRLADSLGRKPLIIAGLIVNATFTGVLGWMDNLWLILLVSVIAGIGGGLLNPAQQATVADVIGNKRSGGKVLATFQMAQDFGAILGPIAIGMLVDAQGYHVAFTACGAIGLVAAGVWLVHGKETRPQPTA